MKFAILWVLIALLLAVSGCQRETSTEPISTMPVQVIASTPAPPPPPAKPRNPLPQVSAPEGAGLYVINEGVDGYINAQGKMVVPPGRYASIAPVMDIPDGSGNAPAPLRFLAARQWQEDGGGGLALVNVLGEVKTEFSYAGFYGGRDGVVFGYTESYTYYPLSERTGEPLLPGEYHQAMMTGGKMLLLDADGLLIADAQGKVTFRAPDIQGISAPGEDMLPVRDAANKWGYWSLSGGKMAIEPQYAWAMGFSEGRGCVGFSDGGAGFVDVNGENVFDEVFHTARPFKDGRAVVRKADEKEKIQSYLIGADGATINETGYDRLQNFLEGNALTLGERFEIMGKDGQIGSWRYFFVARDGSEIALPAGTVSVKALPFDRYLLTVRMDGEDRMGLMDGECNWLLRPETYAALQTAQYPLHLFAKEAGDTQWRLLDLNGQEVMSGFDSLFASDGRLVYCRKDGKTGYLNLSGEWVYP